MERRGLRARAEGRIRLFIAPASRYELQSSRNSVRSYCGQCTRGASKTGAKFTANNIQLFFFFFGDSRSEPLGFTNSFPLFVLGEPLSRSS